MKLGKQLQKAMIDNDIKGAKALAELTGLSYDVTLRLLKDEPSSKLKDVVLTAEALGFRLKFVSIGE